MSAWRFGSAACAKGLRRIDVQPAHGLLDHVGGILTEQEYVALSWLLVSINAFNRITIAGKYPVPPRRGERAAEAPQ